MNIDIIIKSQLSKVALGIDNNTVLVNSISEFLDLAKQAKTSISRSKNGQLAFTYRGVVFMFNKYEFGVSYGR